MPVLPRRRPGSSAVRRGVVGAVALLLLVLIAVSISRLSYAADYAGWAARTGISPFAVKLGWAFAVSMLALFGSAIYVAIELGRDGLERVLLDHLAIGTAEVGHENDLGGA